MYVCIYIYMNTHTYIEINIFEDYLIIYNSIFFTPKKQVSLKYLSKTPMLIFYLYFDSIVSKSTLTKGVKLSSTTQQSHRLIHHEVYIYIKKYIKKTSTFSPYLYSFSSCYSVLGRQRNIVESSAFVSETLETSRFPPHPPEIRWPLPSTYLYILPNSKPQFQHCYLTHPLFLS